MIRVGDEVTQKGWNKYYKVTKVTRTHLYLESELTGKHHAYSLLETWTVKSKPKSGFSKWINAHGL